MQRRSNHATNANPAARARELGLDAPWNPPTPIPSRAAAAPGPHAADALVGQGNALLGLGRPSEALAKFDEAIALDANLFSARNNRGVALRDLGRIPDALASFDAALVVNPDQPDALNNRGRALVSLNRAEEALESFDRAIAASPARAATLNHRGAALMKLGRAEEALANFDAAIAIDPRVADSHNNRGTALLALGRGPDALVAFNRARALAPGAAEILANIGHALMELGHPVDALASYDLAITRRPDFDAAHDGRGNALARLGREREALASYDKAIALNPLSAPAHNNKGLALLQLGEIEEGERFIEAAVALDKTSALSFHNLTLSKTFGEGDATLRQMEALARDAPALGLDKRIFVHFALGKAYADLKRYADSFHQFAEGNAWKRARSPYDEAESLGEMELTRALFSRAWIESFGGRGAPSSAPVFVFGMPRSGTTLVEQILAAHPGVHGAGEIKDFEQAANALDAAPSLLRPQASLCMSGVHLDRLGLDYLARLRARAPSASRIVNKTTENFRFAGLIAMALPGARMIHVRRDPRDVCLSCFRTLFAEDLPFAYDLAELGRYHRAHDDLMAHWREALPTGMMLEVRYEDVVADIEREARRIVDHCGLAWDASCLDFHLGERSVRTASFTQVRRPLYASSVGGWRNYEPFLGPLFEALEVEAEEARAMG
jgi:tetratricopeptide (TPR) repeat protein